MDNERGPTMHETELNKTEKQAILRALGYYQIHLFDELQKAGSSAPTTKAESELVSSLIKKIHRGIEVNQKSIAKTGKE
jgi:hypothetical protein